MAQSSLRQFYRVRKRPQEEHGSLKRRKLTEETRLDLPTVGKDVDPLSLPFTQPTLVSTKTSTSSKTKPSTRRSTRTRARGQTTTRSGRRRKSPPLPATPSIVLPSPAPPTEQPHSDKDNDDKETQSQESRTPSPHTSSSTTATTASKKSTILAEKTVDKLSSKASQPEPSFKASQPEDGQSSPTKQAEDVGNYDEEDPLLLPSCPKSPKQDTTSTTQPSKPRPSDPTTFPPPRSRKNLSDRLKLASTDPPASISSPSSSTSALPSQPNMRRTPAKTASKLSAQELAQKTAPETKSQDSSTPVNFARPSYWTVTAAKTTSAKDLVQKTAAENKSTSVHSRQTNVRKATTKTLSARELAQKTVAEEKSGSEGRELAQKTEGGRGQQTTHRASTPSSSRALDSVTDSEAISRLYKLSARELAQPTEYERRRPVAARQSKGKSPAPPTTPQLHQFQSFVVESPTKSPSKQPAYQRYHNLARPAGSETPDLPLPYKYQVLLEKFKCTDTVVTMLQKRREICTFGKLKQAVEEMTRRKYENRNLGQMETVYPKAFIFRQEKNIPGVYDRKMYESYQLTVECNAREDGREEGEKERVNAVLDSSALLRRKKVFNKNLCEITRKHHKVFLSSLNPPLEIPEEKVLRWHPTFQLDRVPDVEETELPKPPLTECYTTAQDVLNATQGRLTPRVQRALEGVATTSERKGAEPVKEVGGVSAPLDPALRGISQKLLEKIQQKEVSRVRSDITRDHMQEKRLEMISRMPQLTRIIRSLFVTEKKAAIPWDTVVQKLRDSHNSCLPPDGVDEHLEYMQETLGGWLSVVEVCKRKFIKINKNTDSQVLTARMEGTRKKLLA